MKTIIIKTILIATTLTTVIAGVKSSKTEQGTYNPRDHKPLFIAGCPPDPPPPPTGGG